MSTVLYPNLVLDSFRLVLPSSTEKLSELIKEVHLLHYNTGVFCTKVTIDASNIDNVTPALMYLFLETVLEMTTIVYLEADAVVFSSPSTLSLLSKLPPNIKPFVAIRPEFYGPFLITEVYSSKKHKSSAQSTYPLHVLVTRSQIRLSPSIVITSETFNTSHSFYKWINLNRNLWDQDFSIVVDSSFLNAKEYKFFKAFIVDSGLEHHVKVTSVRYLNTFSYDIDTLDLSMHIAGVGVLDLATGPVSKMDFARLSQTYNDNAMLSTILTVVDQYKALPGSFAVYQKYLYDNSKLQWSADKSKSVEAFVVLDDLTILITSVNTELPLAICRILHRTMKESVQWV